MACKSYGAYMRAYTTIKERGIMGKRTIGHSTNAPLTSDSRCLTLARGISGTTWPVLTLGTKLYKL